MYPSMQPPHHGFADHFPEGSKRKPPVLRLLEARLRRVYRWLRPAGMCVAISGADGSGKSSVIAEFLPALGSTFEGTKRFHLRPRMLRGGSSGRGAVTDPHGAPPRGAAASVVKLVYLWMDYVAGYYLCVRPLLVRSQLVIFDRYYYDLLIDPLRFRYGGPMWLARFIARLLPRPDLMFVLYAPGSVLQARKQEVTPEESARQTEAFRGLTGFAHLRGRTVLVDASQPLPQVVQACVQATLADLAGRRPLD